MAHHLRRLLTGAICVSLGSLVFAATRAGAYTITEYPLIVAGSEPHGIAPGPDGNMWFTESAVGGSRIGRITPAGRVDDWSTGSGISQGSRPFGIAAGPDGNLWFTEYLAQRIARITTGASATELPALPGTRYPCYITTGPDGNLWFSEYGGGVGRVTPAGVVTEFFTGITAGSGPLGITPGPDGNLWFTERNGHRIGRITPQGAVTEFSAGVSANSAPFSIVAGPDGNLWFTEYQGHRIGRITPAGVVTEFSSGLSAATSPLGITTGPDGNVWFTEADGNRLGRITPSGAIAEFGTGISPGSRPAMIATGPDNSIWFTEENGNRIGRFSLTPEAATGDATAITGTGARLAGFVRPYARGSVVFEYGPTTAYGSATPSTLVGPSSASLPVAASASGLRPARTYHYRVVVSGPGGTERGGDRTFTTADSGDTGGGPSPGGDTTRPRIRVVSRTLDLRRGRVRVLITCPVAETLGCRAAVRLQTVARLAGPPRARLPLLLGAAPARVGGGQTRAVVIRLSPRGLRLVLGRGVLPVRVVVTARDAAENSATVRVLLALRAHPVR